MSCTLVRTVLPPDSPTLKKGVLAHALRAVGISVFIEPDSVLTYQDAVREKRIAEETERIMLRKAEALKDELTAHKKALKIIGVIGVLFLAANYIAGGTLLWIFVGIGMCSVMYALFHCMVSPLRFDADYHLGKLHEIGWESTPYDSYVETNPVPPFIQKSVAEIGVYLPEARITVEHFYADPFVRVSHQTTDTEYESYYIYAFDEKGFEIP